MNQWIAKQLLSDTLVAVRSLDEPIYEAILRALLQNTDDAVLVTDLEHRSLACNDRFARFFNVDAQAVVQMEVEDLRQVVIPRLTNPERWLQQLDEIYAEPQMTYQDELELVGDYPMVLHRTTGPVQMPDGTILGRLWKFRNVTQEKYRQRLRQAIFDVSTLHDPDPTHVLREVVNKIADTYRAVSVLSIRDGKRMLFREVAGAPPDAPDQRENPVKHAYCQVTMLQHQPLLVDDGAHDPRFRNIGAVRMGFTRYLGATICDGKGRPIGTICMLGQQCNQHLTDDDAQFISMMAVRIQTELERERIYLERTSEQRAMLEQQKRDLDITHSVLEAMNNGFKCLSREHSTDRFMSVQLHLLRGLLGYQSAALLIHDKDGYSGLYLAPSAELPRPLALEPREWPSAVPSKAAIRFVRDPEAELAKLLGAKTLAFAVLPLTLDETGLLVLGRQGTLPAHDEHHRIHLEALVDQVALLLASHRLNLKLGLTEDQLRETEGQLVQSEKLAVVGTLAASVAHDIRNIMTSLQLECVLGGSEPAATLETVRTQLERFSLLAHRLLSYAKPQMLARGRTDVNALLQRTADMVGPQMRITNVNLRWDLDPNCRSVQADSNQAEHLFVNLILNAVQAMHDQGGSLTIRTRAHPGETIIEIKDTGNGIPPDRITSLFEPFQTTRANGFGLGLYSCGRIAAEHGWLITVESEVGAGTTFQVRAPVERE